MRKSIILTAVGCLLGLAGTARAGQISSPAIFGAFFQSAVQCTIGNLGTTRVPVTVNIVDEAGNVVPSGHCGSVEPNFLCQVTVFNIPTGSAFACTATTPGSTAKLRGTMVVLDGGFPLRTAALR